MTDPDRVFTSVEFTNDLVYQTPKADLILLVQERLKNIGLSQQEIVAFSSNTAIPLSLQVTAVEDLEALGKIPGRRAAAVALQRDDRIPGALLGHFAA